MEEQIQQEQAAETAAPAQAPDEQARYAAWQAQAEAAKALYPQLELGAELEDKRFRALLEGEVDVQTAYEVLHREALLSSVMQQATQAAERRLTNQLLFGQRPAENGLSAASPAVSRVDVGRMTRQQRRDIIRRVQMGEKICL